jgi:Cu-Zn family superoxide dismutase
MRIPALLIALVALGGPAAAQSMDAQMLDNKGKAIGMAKITGGAQGTVIRLTLGPGSLTPGWHGIHLHATGDCSDHDKFLASKGHVNHSAKKHGLLNAEGPDDGDLPNVHAAADGSVNAEVSTATLIAALKDADGSALVIHAGPDDHTSQPIGGAGARVACGVIK